MNMNANFLQSPVIQHIKELNIPIICERNLNITSLAKQVNYRKSLIKQLVIHKNVSFANTWFSDKMPKQFIVNDRVQAELSSITLRQTVRS